LEPDHRPGIIYSDGTLSDLNGTLLFVTLKGSDLRVLVPDGPGDFVAIADERVLFDERFGRLRAIAQGPDGALYIATSNTDGRGDPGPLDDRVIRIDPAG
jgi:glucose/arabinose dehydrogenase